MFWPKAQQVIDQALLAGTLLPISTEPKALREEGVDYILHKITTNSTVKFSPKPAEFNPFLPYDSSMYVSDAGSDHVCLLNKFPVFSPHLLICSKTFVKQTTALTQQDFDAWLMGFDDDDVFGFYNGGKTAGASQPHRHMQLVKAELPLAEVISQGKLPFTHRLFHYQQLDPQTLLQDYKTAMLDMGLFDEYECKAYNVLLTSRWMMILPRSANKKDGIFANAINYSGHFLVKNEEQMEQLSEHGVMQFLKDCAIAT